MLWLALRQLETVLELIESNADFKNGQHDDYRSKLKMAKKTFKGHIEKLSILRIQSNVLKTFRVLKQNHSPPFVADEKPAIRRVEDESAKSLISGSPDSPRYPRTTLEPSPQDHKTSELDLQFIALQRTISEYVLEMQPTDIVTVEAATVGFFKDSKDQLNRAWQKTLKLHGDWFIPDIQDPRQIALTLFAAKFHSVISKHPVHEIEDLCYKGLMTALDAYYLQERELIQQPSQAQQTSGTDGALAKRMAIVTPQQASTSSKPDTKSVVDTAFLPDWAYHHPGWTRKRPINAVNKVAIDEISSVDIFMGAFDELKGTALFKPEGHNGLPIEKYRFPPHVGDFGQKYSKERGSSAIKRRYMRLDWFYDGLEFYRRLEEPRSFKEAKKRLIELPTHQKEAALICWLTSPPLEMDYFGDFLRRHGSSTSLFGERIDWRSNIWETEFHLGFYQLVEQSKYQRYDDSLLPDPKTTPDKRRITLVALSFRFVGDLRDRSWTCHFLTSVSRNNGFTGFLDDFFYINSEDDTLYKDTVGQRRILELFYVERILREIEESSREILKAIKQKLNVSRDVQDQSYVSKHRYSNFHLDSGEVLRQVTGQFEDVLGVITEWENRVSARPVQSRWSMNDQKRYKDKIEVLTRQCKFIIRDLRRLKNGFEEQQELCKQRHTHLTTSMQLQDARNSARSAEDVRLFMAILWNMKLLGRNWDYQIYRPSKDARKEMGKMMDSDWKEKAEDLEKSAQLQSSKLKNELRLRAESKWHYFFFWLFVILQATRRYVRKGLETWNTRQTASVNRTAFYVRVSVAVSVAPAWLLIFVLEILVITAFDTLDLMQKGLRSRWNAILDLVRDEQRLSEGLEVKENKAGLGAKGDGEATSEDPEELTDVSTKQSSTESSVTNGRSTTITSTLAKLLIAPPRPIKDYTMKIYPLRQAHEKETQSADSDQIDNQPCKSDDESSDEEDLDFTLDKDQNVASELKGPHSYQGHALQSGTVEDSGNERMPWVKRWRHKLKHWKATEDSSRV
ncbi:MAG: hypothetical protein Q9213_004162 [Squamulea squamosa]